MKKLPLLSVVSILLVSSCLSDLNLDPDTALSYQGNWATPLVNTRINLGDLVEDDSLVSADPSGLIRIYFAQDSIFTQGVYDYTSVPDQEPTEASFSVGSPDISINTNLGTFGGAKMKSITIESGKLLWKTNNPVSDTISLGLIILNTDLNGQVFDTAIYAYGLGETTGEIDITGLNLDLTQGTPAHNNLGFSLGIVDAGNAPNGTSIGISLKYEELVIGEAIGFFGERQINFPSGTFNTNLSILDNLSSGLFLANPQIKLYSTSNIGLPLQINADMIGVGRDGQPVDLDLDSLSFNGSPTVGTFATDTFYINSTTSNIADFIASIPEEIIYSGFVKLNPNGETGTDNFVTSDGLMTVGMEIDLPLELKSENLTIEQTIYNIDFGVEDGDVDFVEELEIGFRVENGFPLEADLFFYFQDSTGTILDSAEIEIFDAAQVNANGEVVAPASGDRSLEFSQENIQNILKSDDIRIKVVLNTSNNGGQIVKLVTDNYIDLLVGARVKLNYNL